jgi:hypothetical protein
MSITVLHLSGFYGDVSAIVALCFTGLYVLFWSGHRILALLRDWREFRRGN